MLSVFSVLRISFDWSPRDSLVSAAGILQPSLKLVKYREIIQKPTIQIEITEGYVYLHLFTVVQTISLKTSNYGTCYSQNTNGLFVTLLSSQSCRRSSYRLLLHKDYTFPKSCLISWFSALTSVQFSIRIFYPVSAQSSTINSGHDSNQFPTSLFYLGNNIDPVWAAP